MSYQEKRSLFLLFSSVIVLVLYGLFVYTRHHETILNNPNDFRFWGKAFLILIPVSIVVNIVTMIVLAIIHKIRTNEDIPSIEDERDKLIELKSIRVSHWVFIVGFLLSMSSQAIGMQPWVMFLTLIIAGWLASCIAEITKFYLYRKGF